MNKEEKAIAYHEAGHALTAYRFGHYGDRITIVPEGNTLGSSLSKAEWADGSKDIEQIIVLFAGFASESKYYPNANIMVSANDNEKAVTLLQHTKETELNLRKKAKEMIEKDWKIIEAMADKLFEYKTLTNDEWSIIIDAFDEGGDWEEAFFKMRDANNQ